MFYDERWRFTDGHVSSDVTLHTHNGSRRDLHAEIRHKTHTLRVTHRCSNTCVQNITLVIFMRLQDTSDMRCCDFKCFLIQKILSWCLRRTEMCLWTWILSLSYYSYNKRTALCDEIRFSYTSATHNRAFMTWRLSDADLNQEWWRFHPYWMNLSEITETPGEVLLWSFICCTSITLYYC